MIDVEGTSFRVELFRFSGDEHDQERFRRRRSVELFGRIVSLPTAEAVIVWKLRWLRRKDCKDIQSVVAVQNQTLDRDCIHH